MHIVAVISLCDNMQAGEYIVLCVTLICLQVFVSDTVLRDPERTYNNMTLKELSSLSPIVGNIFIVCMDPSSLSLHPSLAASILILSLLPPSLFHTLTHSIFSPSLSCTPAAFPSPQISFSLPLNLVTSCLYFSLFLTTSFTHSLASSSLPHNVTHWLPPSLPPFPMLNNQFGSNVSSHLLSV